MTDKKTRHSLITRLADLDESYVLKLVRRLLEKGEDPIDIIKACEQAMVMVGERYEKRKYYLSGLIMAGEILRRVMLICQPFMEASLTGTASGVVLLGTVEGDIHNTGKRMVAVALRCHGFTVEDLGARAVAEMLCRADQRKPARCHRTFRAHNRCLRQYERDGPDLNEKGFRLMSRPYR